MLAGLSPRISIDFHHNFHSSHVGCVTMLNTLRKSLLDSTQNAVIVTPIVLFHHGSSILSSFWTVMYAHPYPSALKASDNQSANSQLCDSHRSFEINHNVFSTLGFLLDY